MSHTISPIYQDESLLVIDKPAGVPVLPDGWEPEAPFLLNQLKEQFGEVWIVHRLDKVTSGVMLFARTPAAHRTLSLLFESHEIRKTYHAIVVGNPAWLEYTARQPLRVNVGHRHRTMVSRKGKPSETSFRVLEEYNGYALLSAIPKTGRTHQIRVHAYALGLPLLGDTLYSAPETDLITRPALHSRSLEFRHPESGEPLAFTAPYPEDFEKALHSIQAL